MESHTESIEFLIQGSASEPYKVTFWRVGNNVQSSCTCQAGRNRLACKHRLNLLDGEVTSLVSSSADGISRLKQMIEGSDVGESLRAIDDVALSSHALEKLLPLKPPGRRQSVAIEVLAQSVLSGGLIKGNQSYYDVFSTDLSYMGSVKVRRGTVFSETPTDYFCGLSLTIKRLTDGMVWAKSQSVYAAASGTRMSQTIEAG